MPQLPPFPLIFAPMEGITDSVFRNLILTKYPEWDYLFTDFLRLSTNETFKPEHIIKFIGPTNSKVVLQILTTMRSTTSYNIQQIEQLKIPWLDLNFGCPSKQVTAHQGGSYLLSKPDELQQIVQIVRDNYSGFLSVKIRSGFDSTDNFIQICKILEKTGVDLITIHPRLKTELYRGTADWSLIRQAQQQLATPIIGNGDIKTVADILTKQNYCNGVMIGRGAIRRPWLAKQFKHGISYSNKDEQLLRYNFIQELIKAYDFLERKYLLSKLKKLTHYQFDLDEHPLKSSLLRAKSLDQFVDLLQSTI